VCGTCACVVSLDSGALKHLASTPTQLQAALLRNTDMSETCAEVFSLGFAHYVRAEFAVLVCRADFRGMCPSVRLFVCRRLALTCSWVWYGCLRLIWVVVVSAPQLTLKAKKAAARKAAAEEEDGGMVSTLAGLSCPIVLGAFRVLLLLLLVVWALSFLSSS